MKARKKSNLIMLYVNGGKKRRIWDSKNKCWKSKALSPADAYKKMSELYEKWKLKNEDDKS